VTGRLLTARDVAGHLSVSIETVLRWRRSGRLPGGYRLATGVLRWDELELEEWLRSRRERNTQETFVVSVGREV
jgi:predicted DNA-binding transcriptional regulator AlpA